jgi:hypothetical protein
MGLGRWAVVLGLGAALCACSGKKPGKGEDQRTATGQILPGSISDGMLPYDALTSQPPVAVQRRAAVESASVEEGAPEAEPSPAAQ